MKVSKFLGKQLLDDVIPGIIEHLSFESMKNNKTTNYSNLPEFDESISPFVRKGTIGDWKNYFSEEQSALVEKMYKAKIESLGINLDFE